MRSQFSLQIEPKHTKSTYDGGDALYLNRNPHPLYVQRPSQILYGNPKQNFNYTMELTNSNCPATTGYTAIPSLPSHPYYGTPDNSNTHHPIPSLRQTRTDQHTYASVNLVSDRHNRENFKNASIYPCYDEPHVQNNHLQVTEPSHDNISLERERPSHFSLQRISQLQVTSFTSTSANSLPQEKKQPAQNKPVQCPGQFPLPRTSTAVPQRTSDCARKFWSKLKASSGVIIASQLQPGSSPSGPIELTKLRCAERVRKVSCPICEGLFATPYYLQGHFPVCVRRTGNPDGLFWDETLPLRWRRYGKCDTTRADKLNRIIMIPAR